MLQKNTHNEFTSGQQVRLQHHGTHEWSLTGTIVDKVAPRLYRIKMLNGSIFRRNSRHIRKVYSLTSNMHKDNDGDTDEDEEEFDNNNESTSSDEDDFDNDNEPDDTISVPYTYTASEDESSDATITNEESDEIGDV